MKPRVLMTTPSFRIVQGPYQSQFTVEMADGRDGMRQRRWRQFRVADDLTVQSRFDDFVWSVGRALAMRAKRRRKS